MIFLDLCNDPNILSVFLFIKYLISIIAVIGPVILIVMISIDLLKLTTNPDQKEGTKIIISRVIGAVVLFFLPTIINLLLVLVNQDSYQNSNCYANANINMIESLKAEKKAEALREKKEVELKWLKAKALREEKERIQEKERLRIKREVEAKKEQEEQERQNKPVKISKENEPIVSEGICYYCQRDYKHVQFGEFAGQTISSHGCGPTSTAVVGCTMKKDKKITPVTAMNWMCARSGCCGTGGTANSCLAAYLKSIGLNASGPIKKHNNSNSEVTNSLKANKMIIVRVGPGTFTYGYHYFVLASMKGERIEIVEVDDRSKNNRTWSYSDLEPSLQDYIIVSGGYFK